MANITFLDLMLAEALASGLAREAQRRTERPPPDNFFLLPQDPNAWGKLRDASKKENMVVCIEFCHKGKEQEVFMDLAREFEGIPFVRAAIGFGASYDEMRADLGGVQFTPTIMMVFYADDSVARAKFEGTAEISNGLATGKIKGVIKELIDRRVKLKMAERLAEGLAQHVKSQLTNRETRIREQYETQLERQMAEKEEEFKKMEEEKKRSEEREEQEKDMKRRLANDKRREERPQHLSELFKLNLDTAPIRELKAIMEKMGISPRGCIDRKDLKEKLHANVPELRLARQGIQESQTNGGKDPIGGVPINESGNITEEIKQLAIQLERKDAELISLKAELRAKSNRPMEDSDGSAKVKKLEENLLETRMLYTTALQDFEIMEVIHNDHAPNDGDSIVLRAKCIKPGIPNKDRVYAMKVLTNYFSETTQTRVRLNHQNEYEVLCRLPPHENIIHMWAFFYDRPSPSDVKKYFKKASNSDKAHGMCLFILMDEHPMSMAEHLNILAGNRGPFSTKVIAWLKDLLNGLIFLQEHAVVHRDLKLNNLLLTAQGKMIICDFGKALAMEPEDNFTMPFRSGGTDMGGNRAHLAPEILNCKTGPKSFLNYSKQPVWAAGVLAYELAGHPSPFTAAGVDQKGYDVKKLPRLLTTCCSNASYAQKLPSQLTALVESMLNPDPDERPSLNRCLDTINNL